MYAVSGIVMSLVFVYCTQAHRMLSVFPFTAVDLSLEGISVENANHLIETLCAQDPNFVHNEYLYGAFNVVTGESMNWDDYRSGPGQFTDQDHEDYNYANFPWVVMEVTCSLVAN
jgi:hypothetical protein